MANPSARKNLYSNSMPNANPDMTLLMDRRLASLCHPLSQRWNQWLALRRFGRWTQRWLTFGWSWRWCYQWLAQRHVLWLSQRWTTIYLCHWWANVRTPARMTFGTTPASNIGRSRLCYLGHYLTQVYPMVCVYTQTCPMHYISWNVDMCTHIVRVCCILYLTQLHSYYFYHLPRWQLHHQFLVYFGIRLN